MTDPLEHPDGKGTRSQDQAGLIDEVIDEAHPPAFDFDLVNDEKAGIYEASVGAAKIAGLPYDIVGDDRVVLLATSVLPEFRRHGIATELIRRVLDDVRAQGRTVTAMCPIVRTYIDNHPGYADLIDSAYPGVTRGSHRA